MSKREGFLFSFLGAGDGICRLDIHLPWTTIDDKVDFILSKRMLSGREIVVLHNSDINGISTSDKFVVNGIFHEMRKFWLTEIDSCVSKSSVGGIVFYRIVEITTSLDIESFRFANQKCIFNVVKVLDDGVSTRIYSGNGFGGVCEFGWICKCGGIAHYNINYFLQKKIVSEMVSFYYVAEINSGVKVFKICLFSSGSRSKNAVWKSSIEQIFLNYLERIALGSAQRHEFGKRKWRNIYYMSSSSKFCRNIRCKEPGIRSCDIDIDILGGSESVQDSIEIDKQPFTVIWMNHGNIKSFGESLAAVLNLVNENIVIFSVVDKSGANMVVELYGIDEICCYRMFKINFNNVIGRYATFQKVIFEYIEKKIALATTSDTCKNLYEAIVLCFNKLRQKVVSLNCHFELLSDIFMWDFIKMSVVYHKKQRASIESGQFFDNSHYIALLYVRGGVLFNRKQQGQLVKTTFRGCFYSCSGCFQLKLAA